MDKEESGERGRRANDTPVKSKKKKKHKNAPNNAAQGKSLCKEPSLSLSPTRWAFYPISPIARRLLQGALCLGEAPEWSWESLRTATAELHKNEEMTHPHNGLFNWSLFNNCLSLQKK